MTCSECEAFRAALATERAARIAVEQERDRIAVEGLQLAAQVAFIRGGDIPSTIEAARAVLVARAEQAEASLIMAYRRIDELDAALVFTREGKHRAEALQVRAEAERDALRTALELVERDISMSIHLSRHAGTDPEAWADGALRTARAALASRAAGPQGETDRG